MEDVIKRFLAVEYGYGYGYGFGYGYGYGDGDGSGDGSGSGYSDGDGDGSGDGSGFGYSDGYGYGYGSGFGYGSGDGDGSGIKSFCGQKVYIIDSVQTLIDSIHGNYARGAILKSDLTTESCYIAKVGNFFAHGTTLKQAFADAQEKYDRNRSIKERIADFVQQYPTLDTKCKGADLFRWHNVLTGSCQLGREQFCNERGINPDTVTMTVREFIELTKNAYGSKAILLLREAYN